MKAAQYGHVHSVALLLREGAGLIAETKVWLTNIIAYLIIRLLS